MALGQQAKDTGIRRRCPVVVQGLVEPAVRRQQLKQQKRPGQRPGQEPGGSNKPVGSECNKLGNNKAHPARSRKWVARWLRNVSVEAGKGNSGDDLYGGLQ